MKKIIELLEKALRHIKDEYCFHPSIDALNDAMALLKEPRFYTPEEWEAETGKPWAENNAVYINVYRSNGKSVYVGGIWQTTCMQEAGYIRYRYENNKKDKFRVVIICATEAGCPGADYKGDV